VSEAVDIPLEAVTGASSSQPIEANGPADLESGGLLVTGRGKVLTGNPVQFDRAG
jgi:hypothetical protein